MPSKGLCRKCYGETRISWVLFNHGPQYNPFRICELVCKDCGRPFFTFWFTPVKRKSKIAKCRLVFDEVLTSAIHKQLAI